MARFCLLAVLGLVQGCGDRPEHGADLVAWAQASMRKDAEGLGYYIGHWYPLANVVVIGCRQEPWVLSQATETHVRALTQSLQASGCNVAHDWVVAPDPAPAAAAEVWTAGTLSAIMERHPACDLIISLVGLPPEDAEVARLRAAGRRVPRFLTWWSVPPAGEGGRVNPTWADWSVLPSSGWDMLPPATEASVPSYAYFSKRYVVVTGGHAPMAAPWPY